MAFTGKKGSTETLSFLIGVIIFVLIVVPFIFAGMHYCSSQSGMQKTLTALVERTSELEDGEKGSIVGYIETNYIMIGFEKDSTSFGSGDTYWSCDTGTREHGSESYVYNIRKPAKCGKRACLCACPISEGKVFGFDVTPGDYLLPGACEESSAKCAVYDEDKNPRFIGGADCEYGPYITHDTPAMEIHFERQGQTIGICEEPPCISKEVEKAREIYTAFIKNYKQCRDYEVKDCLCEKTEITDMPGDYVVQIRNDGETTTITLYDKDEEIIRAKESFTPDLYGRYERNNDDVVLRASDDIVSVLPSLDPLGSQPYVKLPGRIYIELYKSKAGNAVGTIRGGVDALAGYKELCSTAEFMAVAERVGQEGHCTYESNKEGICVKGECDSPLLAEKQADEGKGCNEEGYKCCAPIEAMCETLGGKCKPKCGENEERYENKVLFNLNCPLTSSVCCMPAGTMAKSEYCADNLGICREKCDILSETKTDKYLCETGNCCMPSASLFPNLEEDIFAPYLFNSCNGKCRAGCRNDETGVKITEYITGKEDHEFGCLIDDVCCMKKCGEGQGVCDYLYACPETKHIRQFDSQCGAEQACCKVEEAEKAKGLPVFPCTFPAKCQAEPCNEETQIAALETLMCEDENKKCCIDKAQNFPDTCTPAGGTCKPECNTAGGEDIISGKTCPIEMGNMRYCCKTVSEGASKCISNKGTCKKSPCNEETETTVPATEANCGTGKSCCKPKDDTSPLILSCTDVEGTCRRSPDAGEVLYEGATCEQSGYYCFIPTPSSSACETNGNECKSLPCDNPALAATYIAIHAYDASCGTGNYCCAKRQ